MHPRHFYQPELAKKLSLYTLSLVFLFLGFFSNCWNAAEQNRFQDQQSGSDSLIVGRMIKSSQDGIFSAGGLTGAWVPDNSPARGISDHWLSPKQARNQYSYYFNGVASDKYFLYMSQIGGQGMIYSLLDRLIPVSPQTKLTIFYMFTSLLSATALTLIILWFYCELGFSAALFAACSIIFSQWLTLFGRDLWWSIWVFYLPMIAVMCFFKSRRILPDNHFIHFGILCFIAVFVKCFINGCEFITTTLVMMIIPFVYYSMRDRLRVRFFLQGILMAMLGSFLAVFLSLVIVSFQIASVKGNLQDGFEHIVYSFGKRTYGDAQLYPDVTTASLEASTFRVVYTYVTGSFCDFNNHFSTSHQFISHFLFKIRYYYLIMLFLGMSIVVLYHARKHASTEQRHKNIALLCATWVSILAPLSWYIIFKAHSFIHTPINFILWQMPFTLFGFAVCGVAFRIIWGKATGSSGQPVKMANEA